MYNNVVFYDKCDNDGRGALAVLLTSIGSKNVKAFGLDRDLLTINKKTPLEILESEFSDDMGSRKNVWFLDLAPRAGKDLAQIAYTALQNESLVRIIDHHELNYVPTTFSNVSYVYKKGVSACKLTWEFFNDEKAPYIVELINDRDVWVNEMQPVTNYLVNTYEMMNQEELNDIIDKDEKYSKIQAWLSVGKIREATKKEKVDNIVNKCIDVTTLFNNKVAIPTVHLSKDVFSEVGKNACLKYDVDFFMSSYFDEADNTWKYGLRSLDGQALEFIRANGFSGGGHDNACGFSHDKDLFNESHK